MSEPTNKAYPTEVDLPTLAAACAEHLTSFGMLLVVTAIQQRPHAFNAQFNAYAGKPTVSSRNVAETILGCARRALEGGGEA